MYVNPACNMIYVQNYVTKNIIIRTEMCRADNDDEEDDDDTVIIMHC